MKRNELICGLIACVMIIPVAWASEEPELTYDGLKRVGGAQADVTYVLPEADFAAYNAFIVMEPSVAFRRNWQRDARRTAGRVSRRISDADMERMKSSVADLFKEVFVQRLEGAGFEMAETPGEDVMILRPAILNLDVTAPDAPTGRSRTFVASAGSGSLFIELFDSVTGQILARAVDSRRARSTPTFQWVTPVSNRAEARRALNIWAGMLVDSLNAVRERGQAAGQD